MSSDLGAMVAALQIADSQFPSGAFAFSWGLEGLVREGRIRRGQLPALMAAELQGRWAGFDRYFVARGLGPVDEDGIVALDGEIEAMGWSEPLRAGSRRAGAGLLTAHARMGTPGAAAYRAAVVDGRAHGHLPLVQGVVSRGLGLPQAIALAVSGYGLLSGLGSAAVRLGLCGALEVQRSVSELLPVLTELADTGPPEEPTTFSPILDIAMMRRDANGAALFSN